MIHGEGIVGVDASATDPALPGLNLSPNKKQAEEIANKAKEDTA